MEVRVVISQLLTIVLCLAAPLAVAQTDAPKPPAKVPEVFLSAQHQEMVAVGVGEAFPEIALPTPEQAGEPHPLANRFGEQATVVAVIDGDHAMAKALLRDLSVDINERYNPPVAEAKKSNVTTVVIGSSLEEDAATELAQQVDYQGLLLLDRDGSAKEQLGTGRMPRVYVLNGEGQIEWFDIEYSLSTRREMKQAVAALAKKK